jgi:hypothetical protein
MKTTRTTKRGTKAITATTTDLQTAEARGIESALADHRRGHATWPFDGSLGLSGRQLEIQAAWGAAKRAKLIELGHTQ